MITSLLIANRGEIACRVMRTAKRLGIRSVAVYSDADRNALHVRMADEAVHIGPSPARESYLCGDKIIAAAKQTGAEAIHPGYGFLSENADFAEAVIDAGLIWVGPKPDSIRAMGLKDAAKKIMADAGVPVTPGYLGEDQDPKRLRQEADSIGYPILIKAVAGGGGKGMRKVDNASGFGEALASAKRESAAAFGNDHVLLEKWIESPRHIEVQVFGDSHGDVVHLFERDCSLQRRHQKVIEEAPAPGMGEETRLAVCAAAVRAAKAVNYENAGTVEFIADASDGLRADRIWFMEMNTRLQVEHPVTEMITGQDLVEWQLRVASGETLPKRQDELSISGHSIEARLYAEDPAKGFLPSVGTLEELDFEYLNLRVETGVEKGSAISPFYDPMIAKLVAWRDTREQALSQLRYALRELRIWPVKTNAGFLFRLLGDPEVEAGRVDTGLIARRGDALTAVPKVPESEINMAAYLFGQNDFLGGTPDSALYGFRLNADPHRSMRLVAGEETYEVEVALPDHGGLTLVRRDRDALIVEDGHTLQIAPERVEGSGHGAVADGAITAPMPGKVTSVDVEEGAKVTKGQRLLTLEAMKMEHALTAPFDGVVAELKANTGAQVTEGAVLAQIESEEKQ